MACIVLMYCCTYLVQATALCGIHTLCGFLVSFWGSRCPVCGWGCVCVCNMFLLSENPCPPPPPLAHTAQQHLLLCRKRSCFLATLHLLSRAAFLRHVVVVAVLVLLVVIARPQPLHPKKMPTRPFFFLATLHLLRITA